MMPWAKKDDDLGKERWGRKMLPLAEKDMAADQERYEGQPRKLMGLAMIHTAFG